MTRKPAGSSLLDDLTDIVERGAAVIVVGVDGSPSSWDAFDWAVGESTRLPSELLAVHVQPVVASVVAMVWPLAYAGSVEAADEVVEQLCHEVQKRAHELGIKITHICESGDTATVLTQVAQALNADLIVIGKSTKRVHRLAGSIGRRLIFTQHAPAIVVVP